MPKKAGATEKKQTDKKAGAAKSAQKGDDSADKGAKVCLCKLARRSVCTYFTADGGQGRSQSSYSRERQTHSVRETWESNRCVAENPGFVLPFISTCALTNRWAIRRAKDSTKLHKSIPRTKPKVCDYYRIDVDIGDNTPIPSGR